VSQPIKDTIAQAQEFMASRDVDGWLLYDYRGMNPIFWDTVGHIPNVTRPCWLWIPAKGLPHMVVSFVDQSRFTHLGIDTTLFINRTDMLDKVRTTLGSATSIAMEYSPQGALPRVSRIDAGTLELLRSFGKQVVSSADLLQYATQRWTAEQLRSHEIAAQKLGAIVLQAFTHIGERLDGGITEFEVAEFIRTRFVEEGLEVTDGPAVAVNEHSSDPHFDPTPENSIRIERGDWVLIDLWARLEGSEDTMFGDITWTAYVGDRVPERHQKVFDVVIGGRDAAVAELERAFARGETIQGWQVDRVAREYIEAAGFGKYFNHRLGHSLGREVHSNAVNLDGWETHDTREVIPGVAVTIEPGIYLPEFGVRSEIDLYIERDGPRVTSPVQRSVVMID
jgi:Xaa-Pro aminopeptidase